ncbi:MAG: hypothetical protein ACK4N5_03150 [Myxococcales bacterium]
MTGARRALVILLALAGFALLAAGAWSLWPKAPVQPRPPLVSSDALASGAHDGWWVTVEGARGHAVSPDGQVVLYEVAAVPRTVFWCAGACEPTPRHTGRVFRVADDGFVPDARFPTESLRALAAERHPGAPLHTLRAVVVGPPPEKAPPRRSTSPGVGLLLAGVACVATGLLLGRRRQG